MGEEDSSRYSPKDVFISRHRSGSVQEGSVQADSSEQPRSYQGQSLADIPKVSIRRFSPQHLHDTFILS